MSIPSPTRDYAQFDELAERFAQRFRRGERPSLDEFIARLQEMAEEIREMFPAVVEVEEVEGDARDDARQQPPPAVACLNQIGDSAWAVGWRSMSCPAASRATTMACNGSSARRRRRRGCTTPISCRSSRSAGTAR
jgi:hypothetical protein